MCGIAGILKLRDARVDPALLQQMINMVRYRGPDDSAVYTGRNVGLAHARLSIIDLTTGQQPMHNDDKSLWITFNGEIFNYVELKEELIRKGHKFATRSDTEVILHLYEQEGEECVHHLNGQWAFAIWDEPKQKLFLSRDHVGVRPLFYTQVRDSFLFASEIKCFLPHPEVELELDLEAVDQILTFWVILPPRTAFRHIFQVPPGTSLVVHKGDIRTQRYWTPSYCPEATLLHDRDKQLSEDLLNLLLDATRIRLRSDVPVGVYLSGGLDSTVIAALANIVAGERLRTFSVGFDDSEYDESSYQREASTFLRTNHSAVQCSDGDIASLFPEVIWHAEQPILRTAPAPLLLLSELVRSSGFKVVLTGEGADEIFGGYDIFKEMKIRRFWGKNLHSEWRPLLLKRLYPYMDGIQKQSAVYLKKFFQVSEADLADPFFSHLPRWRLTAKLKDFFSEEVRAELIDSNPMQALAQQLPESFASWDHFNQAEYLEAAYLLPGYILSSQGDRMAMAHSVEGRYPFLDRRVITLAAALPPTLKMKALNQKYLLKLASDGLIPHSIRDRHKQPYRAPEGKSFFVSHQDFVSDLLSPDRIRKDGIFDTQSVMALLEKFRLGRANGVKDNMALVAILSTQLLLDQFTHEKRGLSSCDHRPYQKYAASL